MSKLLFGCGYLGERVAMRWKGDGEQVAAVTRNPQRAAQLNRRGYEAIVADVTRPDTLNNLPVADSVVYAVGYDRAAELPIHDVYAGGLANVLAHLPLETGRLIYISTTGVYGPAHGEWVDENTPPAPQREGGHASLAAERILAAHPLGQRGVILRLAGIYGPGRLPYLDRLQRGDTLDVPITGHLNLIHVDDAAAAVLAAERLPLDKPQASTAGVPVRPWIYNVSDGHSVARRDFYCEIARQLGVPEPVFEAPDPGSPRMARATSDRRISNARMLAELDVQLEFPSYRAGLADVARNKGD